MKTITPKDLCVFASLIIIGVLSRLIPHGWNFTAMGAVALLAGFLLPNRALAFMTPLLALLISDAVIGFHNTMVLVYLAFGVTTAIGIMMSGKANMLRVALGSVVSGMAFFAISNFAVWFEGSLYPKTLSGLSEAYVMGIPFYRNQFASDLILSVGLYFILSRVLIPAFVKNRSAV